MSTDHTDRGAALAKVIGDALRWDPNLGVRVSDGDVIVDDIDIERAAAAALDWLGERPGVVLRELRDDLEGDRVQAREDGDVKRAVGIGDALDRVRTLIARHPR